MGSKSFHFICSPTRCVELVSTILSRRQEELALSPTNDRPWIIWEPVPDLCTPEELENTYAACRAVDVISPNHEEFGALFAGTPYATPKGEGEGDGEGEGFSKQALERQTAQFLARGLGPTNDGAVVVRAGKEGCFVASLNKRKWLPAFHQDSSHVVDPTGGGNGFLGGFAVGLVREKGNFVEAARWGSVAASLCIEQVGVPVLSEGGDGETWNGVDVRERLGEFRRRTT